MLRLIIALLAISFFGKAQGQEVDFHLPDINACIDCCGWPLEVTSQPIIEAHNEVDRLDCDITFDVDVHGRADNVAVKCLPDLHPNAAWVWISEAQFQPYIIHGKTARRTLGKCIVTMDLTGANEHQASCRAPIHPSSYELCYGSDN